MADYKASWDSATGSDGALGQYSNWLDPTKLDHLGLFPGDDANNALKDQARQGLTQGAQGAYGQAGSAGQFADQAQGNYNTQTGNLADQANYLRDLQSGKNSVSAEQLRQGLQQNLAAQNSMAAGAAPQNSAMAARNAANNSARMGYGMAGQQAMAGLQERNQATNNLSNVYLQQRAQDVSAANGARGAAISGYGTGAQAYGTQLAGPADKSWMDKNGATMGAIASAMSDKRLKTDIEDGDEAAAKTTAKLKSYLFKYKDEKHGKGDQMGIMAQDLEKAGLKHAVIETKEGKAVDGAKAATSGLALIASLGKRVSELEGKGKKGPSDAGT